MKAATTNATVVKKPKTFCMRVRELYMLAIEAAKGWKYSCKLLPPSFVVMFRWCLKQRDLVRLASQNKATFEL